MGTHPSVLAYRIPWTEVPLGCSPWRCKELDTTEQLSTHAQKHTEAISSCRPDVFLKTLQDVKIKLRS